MGKITRGIKYTIMTAMMGLASLVAHTGISYLEKDWKVALICFGFSIMLWGFLLYLIKDEVSEDVQIKVKKELIEEIQKIK